MSPPPRVGAAYFGNRILRHVAADMEDLAARGFAGVLHTFSENDLAHNRTGMGRIVRASHAAGLEVQIGPWGVAHLFGGEAESQLASFHPELGQVLETGRAVPAACPNNERVRAFIRMWADEAIETGADRVFWDEPHWVQPQQFGLSPSHWGCRCQTCHELYRERFGAPMPTEPTPEVLAFREDRMVAFLRHLVEHVARQGVRTTVCLLPISEGIHGLTDWSRVASLPGLDTLATDPYWKAFRLPAASFVRDYAERLSALGGAHGVRTQLWIQGFGLSPDDETDIQAAVGAARRAGVGELWTWGYEACAHMSRLAGRDPARVWEILCEALIEDVP